VSFTQIMNYEYMELSRRKRTSLWLRQRLSGAFALDTRLWTYAVVALWLFSCVAVAIAALGMPTGLGHLFDIVTGISLNTIVMALSSAAVGALLAIMGIRIPRFTAGSMLYVGVVLYFILYFSEFGIVGSIIYSVIGVLGFAGLGLLTASIVNHWERKWIRAVTAVLTWAITLSLIYGSIGASVSLPTLGSSDDDRAVQSDLGEVHLLTAIQSDPSETGDYSYGYFTYGSGGDRHRSEFGEDVDVRSQSVNAADYIDDWPFLRGKFWSFDETELPLNGRVWMPEGEGPFPLVLMVHGNHLMEEFSDEGYGYLGELMASRGIVAISIDENFLNYSVWSGIPVEDMKVRAWLLLKHIQEIQSLSQQVSSPFYQQINFQQLVLLGHSRGGQAAAMATDRGSWFNEDTDLPAESSYKIQGVIALAPTDTVVDNKLSWLKGVSYLTLQGAKDSDLVNFYGDRQYGRVSFLSGTEGFKASLYIEDANHSQFNTAWGESDHAFPARLFIRPKDKLREADQRQIAKVYVTAFLETVLHDSDDFLPLFRDYRTGLTWLPSTRYYSQYESGMMKQLADFEGDDRTVLSSGATVTTMNMTEWQHEEELDREGKGKGDNALTLKWNNTASYTVHLEQADIRVSEEDRIVFSMSNEAWDTPALEIEVMDDSGVAVSLPLSQFMSIQALPETDFTWLPGMEAVLSKGKFNNETEPIFQTYELPISEFQAEDTELDVAELTKITFHFSEGPGEVMLDDLGILPE
jgi:hypothetical protein